jgi:hypothetical protein
MTNKYYALRFIYFGATMVCMILFFKLIKTSQNNLAVLYGLVALVMLGMLLGSDYLEVISRGDVKV